MASNLVRAAARCRTVSQRAFTTSAVKQQQLTLEEREKINPRIGDRDVVCYGFNGTANYMDRNEFPFPAIRFKENSAEFMALREKEKGDWKNLSVEEKKALYRHNFCQTFAELNAPTGEWRYVLGGVLIGLSLAGWACLFIKEYVYQPVPSTITREWQEAELERRIRERSGAIEGVASKWDYENNRWKS